MAGGGQTGRMSPVSRGRKGKNKNKTAKSARQPVALDLFSAPDTCDCPACSGEDFDARRLVDEVLAGAADLVTSADPLEAELAGSVFVSIGAMAGEEFGAEFNEALVGELIPAFEARACPETVAMLLAIGSVAPDRVGKAASAAADRLVEAGVPRPGWVGELGMPVTASECWRLSDPAGTGSMLACSFHRAGRSHAVVVSVDDLGCGAATDILLLEADQLPQALDMLRSQARADGVEVTQEPLDPPELRWQIENALDARAVHDSDDGEGDIDELPVDEDGMPGYPAMAGLLRARMRTLPAPNKAPAAHADQDDRDGLTPRELLALPARGVREVAEEAGVAIEPTGISGIYSDPTHIVVYPEEGALQQFAVCFHARPADRDGRLPRPDGVETSAAGWFAPAETPALRMHPEVRRRLRDALHAAAPPRFD